MKFWIIKSEPEEFSFDDLIAQHQTSWTGVRNHQACNAMKLMHLNDIIFFYHSGKKPAIVGMCTVSRTAYKDRDNPKFVVVDVEFFKKIARPLSLKQIRAIPELSNMTMLKQPRLSVMEISKKEFECIAKLVF